MHEPLSQVAALWHAVALVEQVPAVALVPLPQVPAIPQSELTWQAVPAAQVPLLVPPPQVPSPQSVLVWHAPAALLPLFEQ